MARGRQKRVKKSQGSTKSQVVLVGGGGRLSARLEPDRFGSSLAWRIQSNKVIDIRQLSLGVSSLERRPMESDCARSQLSVSAGLFLLVPPTSHRGRAWAGGVPATDEN